MNRPKGRSLGEEIRCEKANDSTIWLPLEARSAPCLQVQKGAC